MASRLVLLVGSNPLPNYLSACALRPDQVTLVYSTETQDAMRRLKQALYDTQPSWTLNETKVDDAACATGVARTIGEALEGVSVNDAWLNYTGGTKVMAAHARMAFKEKGGSPDYASYLDEGGPKKAPCLRFDNGCTTDLESVPLTLKTILGLHGITYKPRSLKTPAPTTQDAKAILDAVLAKVELASQLYKESKRLAALKKPADATKEPFEPCKFWAYVELGPAPGRCEDVSQGVRALVRLHRRRMAGGMAWACH